MPVYTSLKGFNDIGEASVTEQIEGNVISFFDWGLIDKGAFFNVRIPTSGQYGGNRHRLRLASDPNFSSGQIWEAFRSNWVWESGLSTSIQPIAVSGVWVNSTFYPSNITGTYQHYVNYPFGRIVFNTPIPTGSTVEVEYSYKWVHTIDANSVPWFKELQYNSNRVDSSTFNLIGSGLWNQIGGTRVQLPAIVFETVPNGTSKPYALGGGQYIYRDIIAHIFTKDDTTAYKLGDILANQKEKTIFTYNIDSMGVNNRFPLTALGTIASGAMTYPQLVDDIVNGGFRYNKLRFSDTIINKGTWFNASLYHTTVRLTSEMILGNI